MAGWVGHCWKGVGWRFYEEALRIANRGSFAKIFRETKLDADIC